jgi:hypothetical protein
LQEGNECDGKVKEWQPEEALEKTAALITDDGRKMSHNGHGIL